MVGNITYDNRVVAFIDILGFSQIIKETHVEGKESDIRKVTELYDVFLRVGELMGVEEQPEDAVPSRRVTQFSDSIVISFKISEGHAEIGYLINELMFLHVELLKSGKLIRGGISSGLLIHTDKVLFGPAIIHAYEVESLAAINPRVILPQMFHMAYGLEHMITADEDDFYYIDYIDKCQDPNNQIFVDDQEYIDHFERLKEIIQKGLQHRSKPGIYKKYGWMKTKWNRTVQKYKSEMGQKTLTEQNRPHLAIFFASTSLINTSM